MYSGLDKFAHNAQNKFSDVKRATATIAALFTLVNASAVIAAEEETVSLNSLAVAAAPSIAADKYVPAPAGTTKIPGKFVVVLEDNTVTAQAAQLAGGMSIMADDFMAMSFRQQTVSSMATSMAATYDLKVEENFFAAISGFVASMSEDNLQALMQNPNVKSVEEDFIRTIAATQNNATWGLDRIDQADRPLSGTYTYNYDGSGVTAYVVDTGIASHSDFGNRLESGYSAISDGRGTQDCNGHGTHVAGTVGGTTWGVAKNVSLVPVRVLGCDGSGTNSGVIAGVDFVRQNASGPSVANMSLGGGASSALDTAIRNAVNAGVVFVVAAGNETQNACNVSPAREPLAITVASSTSSDSRSSFSNYGSCVDIFAPGSSIKSTWLNGGTNTISGTSMASPHVAGVAALYLDQFPNSSPSQVDSGLKAAAAVNKISGVNGSPNLLVQTTFGGTNPTPTPTPTNTPTPGGDLQNGVPVTGLSANSGSDLTYTMDVPAGATDIAFSISGGSGDADLYVRYGAAPTDSTYDCRPYQNGNTESCTGSQSGGTYYIRVKAYTSFSGVTLIGSYEGSTPTPTATPTPTPTPTPTTPPGGPEPIDAEVTDISASWPTGWKRYTVDLTEGYSSLVVSISGGSGDADLYVNFGSQSSTSNYDCRPYKEGNSETCTFSNPSAGKWYIDLRRYSNFSGVTLKVHAE
ncbi:Extracellular serine proteinase [Thalassocella blandensis]|nr:Extracellular serine proteinase [Thalassocella blandensis]